MRFSGEFSSLQGNAEPVVLLSVPKDPYSEKVRQATNGWKVITLVTAPPQLLLGVQPYLTSFYLRFRPIALAITTIAIL